jgi:hypothetical protein
MEGDEDLPLGLSKEEFAQMVAELERKESANRKRSETMEAKAAAKRAERLSRPPVDHEDAYWRYVDTCPFLPYTEERKAWLRDNPRFEFEGKRWRREVAPMRSNSGKTVVAWNPSYVAEDGERVQGDRAPKNRRNDPDRNWGLPE